MIKSSYIALSEKEFKILIRFLVIGLLNTVLYYAAYSLLLYTGVQYQLATVIGYIIGITNSYFLNKIWAFKSDRPYSLFDTTLFVVIYLLSLAVNVSILTFLVIQYGMNGYVAQVFAIGASTSFSYLGIRFFLFN